MSNTVLHPVLLVPIQSSKGFPHAGQMAGMMGLVLAIIVLGLVIG